jgi:hypothetical protein
LDYLQKQAEESAARKDILFICMENVGRSQMIEEGIF